MLAEVCPGEEKPWAAPRELLGGDTEEGETASKVPDSIDPRDTPCSITTHTPLYILDLIRGRHEPYTRSGLAWHPEMTPLAIMGHRVG